MHPNIFFPPFKCCLPATKITMNLGSVRAITNEKSNSNYNTLKSFRHREKKLVRTRRCFPQIVCQGDFQRLFAHVIVAFFSNLNQEVQCF